MERLDRNKQDASNIPRLTFMDDERIKDFVLNYDFCVLVGLTGPLFELPSIHSWGNMKKHGRWRRKEISWNSALVHSEGIRCLVKGSLTALPFSAWPLRKLETPWACWRNVWGSHGGDGLWFVVHMNTHITSNKAVKLVTQFNKHHWCLSFRVRVKHLSLTWSCCFCSIMFIKCSRYQLSKKPDHATQVINYFSMPLINWKPRQTVRQRVTYGGGNKLAAHLWWATAPNAKKDAWGPPLWSFVGGIFWEGQVLKKLASYSWWGVFCS